jgi:hypothetical protein
VRVLGVVYIVFFVLVLGWCAWGTMAPLAQWKRASGWLYRAGSEPTDAYLAMLRLRNAFGVVLSAGLIFFLLWAVPLVGRS